MSIASVVLRIADNDVESVRKALAADPTILEISPTPPDAVTPGLVLVLETPASSLQKVLQEFANIPGVQELQLVFADYEDDLDQSGFMNIQQIPDHQ